MNTLAWLLFAPLLVPAASSTEPTPEPEPTSVSTPVSFDESALAAPNTIDVRSEDGVLALAGVRAVLDAELSQSDRRYLGTKVLSASRVTLAEGSFAGGKTLVAVNVELRRADPLEEPLWISGVFTLDESGALASMIVPVKSRTERYDLDLTGDVDADTSEDILLSITGSVPHEQLLVTWDDTTPTTVAYAFSYAEGC